VFSPYKNKQYVRRIQMQKAFFIPKPYTDTARDKKHLKKQNYFSPPK